MNLEDILKLGSLMAFKKLRINTTERRRSMDQTPMMEMPTCKVTVEWMVLQGASDWISKHLLSILP
jgi:hypothetical protein